VIEFVGSLKIPTTKRLEQKIGGWIAGVTIKNSRGRLKTHLKTANIDIPVREFVGS